ncbi:MAG: 4-hydroxybenzoate octaprenyltransferase [Gammaproteobacteria bacterium]|nr:MAG: 4-hydroxybenzoate octaprenyltransferase [Gammaproteobacteria bacterium]
MTVAARLRDYALLMRLHRPIGMLLLLWPTLWGLWLSSAGHPDPLIFTVFVAGVVLMRSAGCAINDFADRNLDPFVARTHNRPLATGRLRAPEALLLFAVLAVMAFLLVLQLNRLTVAMSIVAVVLATSYPFLKRYTHLPQFYLGAAFGWSIPMAFAAHTGTVPLLAWVLFLANVFWAVAYDTAYSMVDREDDIRIGAKSTAILFGAYDRLLIGVMHTLTIALLVLAGGMAGLGALYYLGLAVAAGLAVYQQHLTRARDREGCFRAFLNNNWFGAAVFVGLLLDYMNRGTL